MNASLRYLALVACILALVACGPPRKSVFPPSVSLQQVQTLANGSWQLTVRIQNNSFGEMDLQALEGLLQITNGVPVRLAKRFELDIPAFAADVLPLQIVPTPTMRQALAAIEGKGSAATLAYRLSGVITAKPEQEKLPRDFSFQGESWLSPVPGIANTYR